MKLHAESPLLHAESSCILHAKESLLYTDKSKGAILDP